MTSADMSQGQVFHCLGHATWTRVPSTAENPSCELELLIGGVVVQTAHIVNGTTGDGGSATLGFKCEAFITIKTTGLTGTLDACVSAYHNFGYGSSDTDAPTNVAIDTTVTKNIEMRIRMNTAVASNTLTVRQGFTVRLKN